MSTLNIAQIVKDRFRPAMQAASSRYFLLKVAKITVDPKNPDQFRVSGVRVDTGENAHLVSKKSSSGQKLPKEGEVVRADKASPMSNVDPGLNAYRSEYFYSYGDGGFCLSATALPSIPRKNEENGMWSAQVMAVDSEAAIEVTADSFQGGSIDAVIADILRPWESGQNNAVTHDVMGRSLWGDGQDAVRGVTPFATVRFAGESVRIYGAGAIKAEDADSGYRLPTRDETVAAIGRNKMLNSLKSAFEGLPAEALKEHGVAVIPGVALQVGRESLSGDSQNYLKVPNQFQWTDDKNVGDDGLPIVRRGFRDAFIHIKPSRTGNMIVVDTVPASGGTFSRGVPLTPQEVSRQDSSAPAQQASAQPQPQPQPQQQAAAPAQQKQTSTQPQQQEVLAQQAAPAQQQGGPAADQFPPLDDFNENEYSMYADELAGIEEASSQLDDLFGEELTGANNLEAEVADDFLEAQMAAAKKRTGPRM